MMILWIRICTHVRMNGEVYIHMIIILLPGDGMQTKQMDGKRGCI